MGKNGWGIVGADYANEIWRDTLHVIGGIFLGGVCAMVVLLQYLKRKETSK